MRRVQLLIEGRVQGVGFRYWTRHQARSLGVVGWVRNLPDGRVELLAEGEAAPLEALVQWCHQGPPGAWVADVQVRWEAPAGDLGDHFYVAR